MGRVLICADPKSRLARVAAERRKILKYDFEASSRSFDARAPSERDWRIIDQTSVFRLAMPEQTRRYLMAEELQLTEPSVFPGRLRTI